MRSRNVPIRAFAALVALLLVAGQALGTLHQLLVQHTVCAEHGELIHADPDASAPRLHIDDSDPSATIGGATQAHGHEHCGVLGRTHENRLSLAPRARAVVPVGPSVRLSFIDVQAAVRSRADILLFAPKLSPPG